MQRTLKLCVCWAVPGEDAALYQTGYKSPDRGSLRERYNQRAFKGKIGEAASPESQETFLHSILHWEHHGIKKINESSVCTSIDIQFQAVTEEAAQPKLKVLLTVPVALLL